MTRTYTQHLRLLIDDTLTATARRNLEILDTLGATLGYSASGVFNLRSSGNIVVEPESSAAGGSGVGGDVRIGTDTHDVDLFQVYATEVNFPELRIRDRGSLKLQDSDSDHYVALRAPAAVSADVTWDLPPTDGSAGQLLTTDGAGGLGWVSALANPTTTTGDMLYASDNVGTLARLAVGASGTVLHGGATPSWSAVVDADISASAAITLSKLAALTADRALVSDAGGEISASSVTATELGYLSGVTSAVQTQIDARQPLDADLTAVAALSGTGLAARTASNTWAQRSVVAGSSKVSVTNGDGASGNPTVDVSEANLTHDNIGGTLGIAKGGTGQTTAAAAFKALAAYSAKGQLPGYDGSAAGLLAVGADGTVLTADAASTYGVKWGTSLTNPMTTRGDIITGGTSGAAQRLAVGAANKVLRSDGTDPSWSDDFATGSLAGRVSTAAQTFAGLKTFSGGLEGSHKGQTSGTSIAAGYVGEWTSAECSAQTATTVADTDTDVTGMTLSLTAGVWLLGYDISTQLLNSTVAGTRIGRAKITTGGNVQVAGTEATVAMSMGATGAAGDVAWHSISRRTVVNVGGNASYKVRIACSVATASGSFSVLGASTTGTLTNPDNASVIWALRIA